MKVKGIDLNGNETEFEVESKKMNKGLEALKELQFQSFYSKEGFDISTDIQIKLDIIETELNRLEKYDGLMKKYELGSLEELEKIIGDFDNCCQDLINVMGFVAALQSFIESKGLTPESKQFVRKYMESLKKEGK